MRARWIPLLPIATAGCSLLLSDGYSSGERVVIVVQDGGPAPGDGSIAPGDGEAGAPSAYRAEVLADRPVAYYPLDEVSGAEVKDASGNARHGRLVDPGGADWAIGGAGPATGTAVRLRTAAGIEVGNTFDFPGRVDCSFEAWVRPVPGVGGWRRVFDKVVIDNGPIDGTYWYWNPDVPKVQIERWSARNNRQTAGIERVLPTDRYTHLVAVIDDPDVILYADGVEITRGLSRDAVPSTTVPAHWGTDFFGDFDELAIYDRALPADRVRAHYDAAKKGR